MDHPDAATLRTAIVATRTALPTLPEDEARYLERVADNLDAILQRESTLGPDARAATLAELGSFVPDAPNDLRSVLRQLDTGLRTGAVPADDALHEALMADVRRRIDIHRPGYDQPTTGPTP